MSDQRVTSALTPNEWATLDTEDAAIWDGEFVVHCELSHPPTNQHGLAALALYGQPFGFTQADVDALLRIASDEPKLAPPLLGLAARIAALLPPRNASAVIPR